MKLGALSVEGLTRRFGAVRLFTASVLLFVLASWLCGFAHSLEMLDRRLGDGRGAGAADREVSRGQALRKIGEEGREFGLEADRGVDGANRIEIVGANLLDQLQAAAHAFWEEADRLGKIGRAHV